MTPKQIAEETDRVLSQVAPNTKFYVSVKTTVWVNSGYPNSHEISIGIFDDNGNKETVEELKNIVYARYRKYEFGVRKLDLYLKLINGAVNEYKRKHGLIDNDISQDLQEGGEK